MRLESTHSNEDSYETELLRNSDDSFGDHNSLLAVVEQDGVSGRNLLSVQLMKTNLNLLQTRIFCAVALGIGSSFGLAAAKENSADTAPGTTAIPWSQLGAKAGADYQGDALAVIPTAGGARLRCAFQRLEGEATREGLWLTSTVTKTTDPACPHGA